MADSDGPRLALVTPQIRIVELPNGTKVLEKFDGEDAMGDPRWRELRIGEADNVSRLLRDWIFEHLAVCERIAKANGRNTQ